METAFKFILSVLTDFWATLSEMSAYLLFGFLIAGILSVWLSPQFVEKHLGKKRFSSLLKASLFGIPLPLCSCGVIPVAASLRKHGASKAATVSFLLSTPQTGVDSFFVTYSLLGPIFAIFRPLVTFITGLIGGISVQLFDKQPSEIDPAKNNSTTPQTHCTEPGCPCKKTRRRLLEALKYGFITLPSDIGKAMFLGLLLAGLISAAIPSDFFAEKLGTGFFAMVVMMLLGIPVYVCATASVPIAAVLIAKGLTPGAALVFLMTGPATNAAGLATIWKILGHKTAIIYLITVAVCALAAGLLLDNIAFATGTNIIRQPHWMLPTPVKYASAVILLIILAYAILTKQKTRDKKTTDI